MSLGGQKATQPRILNIFGTKPDNRWRYISLIHYIGHIIHNASVHSVNSETSQKH